LPLTSCAITNLLTSLLTCSVVFQCDEGVKQCEQYMSAYKLLHAEMMIE